MASGIMETADAVSGQGAPTILDTVAISNELTKMKAHKHTFGYYTYDDISQEMWLMVHEASGRFDPTKVKKPMSFFNVHTENRLNNLKRDKKSLDRTKKSSLPIIKEDNSFTEFIEFKDLVDYIEANMPTHLLKSFKIMLNYGSDGITSYMKKNVRDSVVRLLERYKNG